MLLYNAGAGPAVQSPGKDALAKRLMQLRGQAPSLVTEAETVGTSDASHAPQLVHPMLA